MDTILIKILNEDSVEVPVSIWNINLTYKMWNESITPWEHRRIFRTFKLPYSIGNKYKELPDKRINYNKIKQKIYEIKGLKKATLNLAISKVINEKRYELCDDIILRIIDLIH